MLSGNWYDFKQQKKVDTVADYCIVTLIWGDIFTAMHDHSRN